MIKDKMSGRQFSFTYDIVICTVKEIINENWNGI